MSVLGNRLLATLALRPGELPRALLTFAYLFLIIASYLLIKAIRNSLFISAFGAFKLPYVMIGIALLAGLFAAGYIRLSRRLGVRRLIVASLLFFVANVLLLWWWSLQGHVWLYPVLYLWAGVFGVIAPTQVWTLANLLFDTREAKRVFGLVGAGGILGAVFGGELASRLAPLIGTQHLLLVVAAMLTGAALAAALLSRMAIIAPSVDPRWDRGAPRNLMGSLRLVAGSRHLRLLAGLVFVTAMATTSVDFQFSVVAEQHLAGRDALTAFFGKVYGRISLVAFLVQLLLTSRALRHLGVGISVVLLPMALVSSTVVLLGTGALWAGVLLKGSDGALKHSLDRSCRELLYLPVPVSVKLQAKSTIDTVMDRLGDGTAGILQLLLISGLGLGLRGSLAANLLVIGTWLVLALRLKGQYVGQLREALGRASRVIELPAASTREADLVRALERMLRDDDRQRRLAALEWIAGESIPVDETRLLELARDDPDAEVRRAALAALLRLDGDAELPTELSAVLEREGRPLLIAAIDLLLVSEAARPGTALQSAERIGRLIDDADADAAVRLPLVALTLRRLGREFEPFAERCFAPMLAGGAPAATRLAAVRALELLPAGSGPRARLDTLLDDPDPAVRGAAAETLVRCGRRDHLPEVVGLLRLPEARVAARRALAGAGGDAVAVLQAAWAKADAEDVLQREIPRALASLNRADALELLRRQLSDASPATRGHVIDLLHRARRASPDVPQLDGDHLYREVVREVRLRERLDGLAEALAAPPDAILAGRRWLQQALDERRLQAAERIFKLLALQYSVADMHRTWLAVRENAPGRLANALELLDNVLPRPLRTRLLPLFDSPPADRRSPRQPDAPAEVYRRLIEGDDPWLAACAMYAAREEGRAGLEEQARRALSGGGPVLNDEARAYLASVAGETGR